MKKKQTYPHAEERLRKALERLGTDNPKCAHCPETDPLVLQRHHVAARQYGEATIIECANCHARLSDAQKDHPSRIDANPPTTLESVAHLLLGLADLLRLAASKLDEIGRGLIHYVVNTTAAPVEGGASC